MDLRTFMSDAAITQMALASRLGVTQGLISMWATGERRIPAERVLDIERATGGKVSRHDLRPDLYPAEEAA